MSESAILFLELLDLLFRLGEQVQQALHLELQRVERQFLVFRSGWLFWWDWRELKSERGGAVEVAQQCGVVDGAVPVC